VADLVTRQCLRYAKQQEIRHVVLLGDVCDGTRLSYPAQRALNRILSTNFHFHIILGNHDLESPDTKFGHSLDILKDVMRKDIVSLYETPTDTLLMVTMGQAADISFIRSLLEEGLADPVEAASTDKSAAVVEFTEPATEFATSSVTYMKDFLARVEASQRAASKSAADSAAIAAETLNKLRAIENNTRVTPNKRSA
jgi:hypothetical protein